MTHDEKLEFLARPLNDPKANEEQKHIARVQVRKYKREQLGEPNCDGDNECLDDPIENRDGKWLCVKHGGKPR